VVSGARLRFPRIHARPADERGPLPLSPSAVAIRENLAERCQQLDELDPRALDLAASALAALHEEVNGRMTELRGAGSPEHMRRRCLGRDGLSMETLGYLALYAPEGVAALLRVFGGAIGYTVTPDEPDECASVPVELAHVERAIGDALAGITERLEDGLTPEEAAECDALVHDLERHIRSLEAALHETALGRSGR
jgi:hypothetical protein